MIDDIEINNPGTLDILDEEFKENIFYSKINMIGPVINLNLLNNILSGASSNISDGTHSKGHVNHSKGGGGHSKLIS